MLLRVIIHRMGVIISYPFVSRVILMVLVWGMNMLGHAPLLSSMPGLSLQRKEPPGWIRAKMINIICYQAQNSATNSPIRIQYLYMPVLSIDS